MINVLIEYVVFLLLLLFTSFIHSNEIFPCNITTNLDEENIRVQYQTKTIQDGRRKIFFEFDWFKW